MRIAVIAVGKLKDRAVRELVDDYAKRISRYARYEEIEIKDGDPPEVAARIAKAIPERARVVALEVEGERWASERLARFIGTCADESVSAIAFLIGGAYGLPPETSRAAATRLSLSAMTLPHRLARLVLVEQVYRAFTILRKEPYSH